MSKNFANKPNCFLYVESGGSERGQMCLALTYDDPGDIPVSVEPAELTVLQGLYVLAPDKFRRLMNLLVDTAYQAGLSAKAEVIIAARRAQFQAIEDEILKHEPGSGVARLDLRGYIGRPNSPD